MLMVLLWLVEQGLEVGDVLAGLPILRGHLGIGVQPSVSKLHVGITSTATSGLAEANALKIENNNATVNNAAGLFLSQTGDAGCGIAGIATSRTGGSRTSALALYYYNQATSASPIEGARLDASGNLLVGTTGLNGSWNTKLTLSNDSGTTKWAVGPYLGGVTNFLISAGASAGVYLNGTAATSWTSASANCCSHLPASRTREAAAVRRGKLA